MNMSARREQGRRLKHHQATATLMLVALLVSGPSLANTPRTLAWPELTPPGWQSTAPDFSQFFHDPSAPAAPQETNAPIVESLHDTSISIRGFIVPLEWEEDAISEFLFVPWFGACLHFPPPPPNQIIRVHMERSLPEVEMFHPQILSGRLLTERSDSDLAIAGYQMVDARTQRTAR